MEQGSNVAVIQALFEEFARGGDELAFATFDEEVVWDGRGAPLPELDDVFHGHDGVRRWWRGWLAAWERIDVYVGPVHHVNGNQVTSVWRQRNRGRGSGIDVDQDAGLVWTFENGRIVRVSVFADCAAALRAGGIDPDAVDLPGES